MPVFSCIAEEKIDASTPGEIRGKTDFKTRLDRYVSENLRLLSRSQIKARKLKAKLNGKEVKLSHPVKHGDHLELNWDDAPPPDIIPQEIPIEIIHEDVRCIVINKAQGMVVHPGAGNRQGTLVNALFFIKEKRAVALGLEDSEQRALTPGSHGGEQVTQSGYMRPGIVHRLDKDTSGLIIAAWDDEAHAFLAEQFKNRKVKKNYIALVCGVPKDDRGCIETNIARDPKNRKRFTVLANGKHAITYYKVIKKWQNYSLLLLRPRTGRTHQLRVHLRHIGCPILGDPIYSLRNGRTDHCGNSGKQFPNISLMLHSKRLVITLPGETTERIFTSAVPERFLEVINKLDKTGIDNG